MKHMRTLMMKPMKTICTGLIKLFLMRKNDISVLLKAKSKVYVI